MRKLLLVKYAPEIFLKGLNKNKFEKKLKDNIRGVLSGVKYEFISDQGRWFLYSEDLEEVIIRVKKVFGIAELCIVTQIETDIEKIYEEALRELNECGVKTFKVETNRANKNFSLNSMEVNRKVGAYILDNNKDVTVDVKNPEVRVNIEIRGNAYIYSKRIKAAGGMPYGTNGKDTTFIVRWNRFSCSRLYAS